MTAQTFWEIVGYAGSAIVLVSLLMTSVVKLRILNTLGSLIFCIYAFVTKSYPTAVMNVALVAIDLYFLYKLTKTPKSFTSVQADAGDSGVKHLVETCGEDIDLFFRKEDIEKADRIFLIYHDMTVAGVLAVKEDGKTLDALVDYTTPAYRDCSVGHFIYKELADMGYTSLVYKGDAPEHVSYCRKMGFTEENGTFTKTL